MTAAAVASSRALRFRQSFSRRRAALSASRLESRSSCSTTGTSATSARSRAASASTSGVCSFGSPDRRRGNPMIDAAEAVRLAPERAISAARSVRSPRAAPSRGDRFPRPRQHPGGIRQRQSDPLAAVVDARGGASNQRTTPRSACPCLPVGERCDCMWNNRPHHEALRSLCSSHRCRSRHGAARVLDARTTRSPNWQKMVDARVRRHGSRSRAAVGARGQAAQHQAARSSRAVSIRCRRRTRPSLRPRGRRSRPA